MKFIGNCLDVIDWAAYLESIKDTQGRQRGRDQEDDIHHNPKVTELRKQWQDAGYENNHAVGWLDYDIPQELVDKFADWLGVNSAGGWVTSVPPGYCVPWHYDITDDEQQMLSMGTPLRYTCHICTPKWGQVFVLENHAFYKEQQGNVYQWNDWQAWHGGLNMGLEPKFLFNFIGYAK
jgi:hypothetical protein